MSGKIVLYDRENLLGDNFSDVLYRENFLQNRQNYLGANSSFLNYP